MAAEPERLDVNLAAATHQDMLQMVEYEKKNRKKLLDLVSVKKTSSSGKRQKTT